MNLINDVIKPINDVYIKKNKHTNHADDTNDNEWIIDNISEKVSSDLVKYMSKLYPNAINENSEYPKKLNKEYTRLLLEELLPLINDKKTGDRNGDK